MYFPRKLFPLLKGQINSKEIMVLTGMRRVGKTTLLKALFDDIESNNKVFLDIENPINQKIFEEKDFDNILYNLKTFGLVSTQKASIFLDEIGAMPNIVKAVKYLYDHYNIKFFLTGSSSFYLKHLFPESLAGRKVIFELYPLDFAEFLVFKQIKKEFFKDFIEKDRFKNQIVFEKIIKYFDEYMTFGGFPEVVLEQDFSQKNLKLEDIFKSYFEKDVATLSDFKNISAFRDLLLLLFARAGSKLDISKLSREVGVSRETVYSYISFLQGTYAIDLISQWGKNIDRQVSGAKKVYLCDNGFLSQFARVSEGSLFENAVYLNLRKYGKVCFFQKRTGAEIDFILESSPDDIVGIEVKLSGNEMDYKKLKKQAKNLRLKSYYIITKKFTREDSFIPAVEL